MFLKHFVIVIQYNMKQSSLLIFQIFKKFIMFILSELYLFLSSKFCQLSHVVQVAVEILVANS